MKVAEPITEARLRRIGGLRTLRTLDLGGTQITGEGLSRLSALRELATIDLHRAGATDAAVKPLSALVGLEKVDLTETNLSPAGVAELRRLRPGLEVVRYKSGPHLSTPPRRGYKWPCKSPPKPD